VLRLALIIHGIEAWKQRSWLYGLMLKSVDSFIVVSRYSAERLVKVSNKQFSNFSFSPIALTLLCLFLRCWT
jgi:hypothetical protein